MTDGLLVGGRAQPADGGLPLQAAHALFQALQIDIVGRIPSRVLGRGKGRAALAEGPARSVEAFRNDLATGPRYSRVEQVEERVLDPTGGYSSFRVDR